MISLTVDSVLWTSQAILLVRAAKIWHDPEHYMFHTDLDQARQHAGAALGWAVNGDLLRQGM